MDMLRTYVYSIPSIYYTIHYLLTSMSTFIECTLLVEFPMLNFMACVDQVSGGKLLECCVAYYVKVSRQTVMAGWMGRLRYKVL